MTKDMSEKFAKSCKIVNLNEWGLVKIGEFFCKHFVHVRLFSKT